VISLPGVESQVFETKLENWEGLSDPVDLILMFHVLYYVPDGERLDFLQKVHDKWLASGGYVAVMHDSSMSNPESEAMIVERLGTRYPGWEDIEADFLKVGFTKHYAYEMHIKIDLSNPEENVLRFYQLLAKGSVTLDDVFNAIKELFPEGKAKEFSMIAVFKRTN